MQVRSLISDNNQLIPVEVELTLWPGLPMIQFLGLPDQHLKESALRIKSAIKASGFDFPVAQQILVNLRPSYIKKNSRGVELAVAAAYLYATGQVEMPSPENELYIYGELSLSGDVLEPDGLIHQFEMHDKIVLTGECSHSTTAPFTRQVITKLSDLANPREKVKQTPDQSICRPDFDKQMMFSQEQARQIKILAVGGHSAIFAGAAGSGKTTVAKNVIHFRRRPSDFEFAEIKRTQKIFSDQSSWRPLVRPHHSIPVISMIGGGVTIHPGEISRAHLGVLVLDELLEFHPLVQEALREPMEEGVMRVHRLSQMKEYPARVQVIATTNLCPCGDWSPLQKNELKCCYSEKRCRSYGQKLSGPFVDRFETIFYVDALAKRSVVAQDLLTEVEAIYDFIDKLNLNSGESLPMSTNVELFWQKSFESHNQKLSERRKIAIRKVASTLALLDFCSEIKMQHLDESILYCRDYFQKLKRWDLSQISI